MRVKGVREREITTCCLRTYQTRSAVKVNRVSVPTSVREALRKVERSPFFSDLRKKTTKAADVSEEEVDSSSPPAPRLGQENRGGGALDKYARQLAAIVS